jgi:hypothetical protein
VATDSLLIEVAPTTNHPLHAENRADRFVASKVHRRLFEPAGDTFRSELVAEWSVADGVLSLTLGDRKWSDGAPIVAADVCATIDRLSDLARPSERTGLVRAVVSGCAVVDQHHATLPLRREVADPRGWLAVPLLPAHRQDWLDWVPGDGPEPAFVGSGDWTPRRDKKGWSLEGPGALRLVVVEDPVASFVAGEGTQVFVEPAQLGEVRALDGVTLDRFGPPIVWALALDTAHPPYADATARLTLDRGLDRVALAEAWLGRDPTLEKQPWRVVSGPWPAGSAIPAPGIEVPMFDAAAQQAAGSMAAALAVPLTLPDAALAALPGLTATVVDGRSWVHSVLAGGHVGTSQAALVRLDGPPCAWFETRGDTTGPRNVFGFSDPEVDAACRALDRGDPDAAWTLHGLLTDRRPALFLFSTQERLATRR